MSYLFAGADDDHPMPSEEDDTRRPRKRRASPVEASEVPRLIRLYHDRYLERHGVKPLIYGGRDGQALKRMIRLWGVERVEALLVEFVTGNDPWAVRQGWTLAAFAHVAPAMVTRASGLDERTASNVEAARRATRRT